MNQGQNRPPQSREPRNMPQMQQTKRSPLPPKKRKMKTGFKVLIAVLAILLVWGILAFLKPNPFAKPFVWLYGCYRAGDANREDPDLTANAGTFEKVTFTDETEDGPMRPTGEPVTGEKPQWKIDATSVTFDAAGLPSICNTEDVFNVLLIGLDTRDASSVTGNQDTDSVADSRSDTVILASVNTKTHQITLTSFLRDTYVEIPGVGRSRLTHAFFYGQAPLLIQTLKQNFNVQVDYYVYLNFYIFIDIVDAMGGLDIEMTADEVDIMNKMYLAELNTIYKRPYGTDYLEVKAGTYHLNGFQTLGYVRNRYSKSANGDLYDWSRVYRQKHTLELMKEKAKTLSLGQLNDLAKLIMSKLTTNRDRTLGASLIMNAMDYMKYEMKTENAPELTTADGTKNVYDNEGNYQGVTFDYKKVLYRCYETIYGKAPDAN